MLTIVTKALYFLKFYICKSVILHEQPGNVTKNWKERLPKMGLAAGQARLLSITARKSDCEYQSMSLSHQKLAISRDLAAISSEYQNSLDQTKLMYDFYGNGSSEDRKSVV